METYYSFCSFIFFNIFMLRIQSIYFYIKNTINFSHKCVIVFLILHTHTHKHMYIDMADVMSTYHGGDGDDELPKHPPLYLATMSLHCLIKGGKILSLWQYISFLANLEVLSPSNSISRAKYYVVGQYSDHYIWHIRTLIRQYIPLCYRTWKSVLEELRVSLFPQGEVK